MMHSRSIYPTEASLCRREAVEKGKENAGGGTIGREKSKKKCALFECQCI